MIFFDFSNFNFPNFSFPNFQFCGWSVGVSGAPCGTGSSRNRVWERARTLQYAIVHRNTQYAQIRADMPRYARIRPDMHRYVQVRPDMSRYTKIRADTPGAHWAHSCLLMLVAAD